jgi:hypothetical protein
MDLKEMGFDLELTGFDADEIGALFDGEKAESPPEDFNDADETEMTHICPKCGFEFDD